MVQARSGISLALEAVQTFFTLGIVGSQQLDGRRSPEHCVLCKIDFTHAARAEQRANLITPESGSFGQTHRGLLCVYAKRRSGTQDNGPNRLNELTTAF